MKIIVFLPAHNEEVSLPLVLKRIPDMIDGIPVETLVIDDGSVDATSSIARQHRTRRCSPGRTPPVLRTRR